ncbi:MAG: methyltransferase domain-containing protein [Halobacteriota archaeon]
MKPSCLRILSCPRCKGELQTEIEQFVQGDIIEGNLFCRSCNVSYPISDGIPNLYVPDDEAIENSSEHRFSQLIVTQESLSARDHLQTSEGKGYYQSANRALAAFLVSLGWVLLFLGGFQVLLVTSFLQFDLFSPWLLVLMAFFVFAIDYGAYRSLSASQYQRNLNTLRELSIRQKLSEYDMSVVAEDKKEPVDLDGQRSFVAYKGAWIQSVLDREGFDVDKALNVGCGGLLHGSASKPYFDHGYTTIGLDVSRKNVQQFAREFDAEAVLANSMTLPFRPTTFDLVGFTDILEHLHHPLLGLLEAGRVLKVGGVILLSTNNSCAIKSLRCLNPLVLAERALSLRYDEILPPKGVLGAWTNLRFYHTEFSKNEITSLLKASGFCITSMETRFPMTSKINVVNAAMDIANTIFGKMPLLKHLCSEFFIVAVKDLQGNA